MRPAKTEMNECRPPGERRRRLPYLLQSHQGRDVKPHARPGQFTQQVVRRLFFRVHHRNLHIDIAAPGGYFQGLSLHGLKFIGKDFKGDRPVRDRLDNLLGKGAIIIDRSLPHQGGIGGKALDQRIGIHFQHAGLVSPVCEDLDR